MHYIIKQFSIKKLLTNRYNNIWPLYIYERRRHIHVYIAFSLPSFLPSSLLHPVSPFLCLSVTLSVTLSLSPLSLSPSLSLLLSLSLLTPSLSPSLLSHSLYPSPLSDLLHIHRQTQLIIHVLTYRHFIHWRYFGYTLKILEMS